MGKNFHIVHELNRNFNPIPTMLERHNMVQLSPLSMPMNKRSDGYNKTITSLNPVRWGSYMNSRLLAIFTIVISSERILYPIYHVRVVHQIFFDLLLLQTSSISYSHPNVSTNLVATCPNYLNHVSHILYLIYVTSIHYYV